MYLLISNICNNNNNNIDNNDDNNNNNSSFTFLESSREDKSVWTE